MFNQKRFLKLVIIIIVFILISGIYFVFNKKDKNIPAQNTENQSSQSSQSIDGDLSIDNWKIYRNEEYGFEMEVPMDWEVSMGSSNEISIGGDIDHYSWPSLSVATSSVSARETIYDLIKENHLDEFGREYAFGNAPELLELSQIVFGDDKGTELTFFSPVGFYYYVLVVEHKGITFIIRPNDLNDSDYEKILSTFKFAK